MHRDRIQDSAARPTRAAKTGLAAADLRTRWLAEASALGIDARSLGDSIVRATHKSPTHEPIRVGGVLAELAEHRSVWHRLDVLRALCDLTPPQRGHEGATWAAALGEAVDTVLGDCIDLDPTGDAGQRRPSDGRSIWAEPIAAQATSEHVLAQEERILTWAMSTQVDDPQPAANVDRRGLDDAQHAAASAVAGHDQLVVVVGPAGAGKTRLLDSAVFDLCYRGRPVIGVAPTALVLVGDPYQLAPAGRGGMFTELCESVRTVELDQLHRFTEPWEGRASLALRRVPRVRSTSTKPSTESDPDASTSTSTRSPNSCSPATTEASNRHHDHPQRDVAAINDRIQRRRAIAGQLDPDTIIPIGAEWAMIGDVIATRHNDRRLRTSRGDHVRNRERWIVTATHPEGDLTVSRLDGYGAITLPARYVHEHVELAYATTEYGAQGVTADRSLTLATTATTGRGLYVGMTRGRNDNLALAVTEEPTSEAARDALESTLAIDRADVAATRFRQEVERKYIDDLLTPDSLPPSRPRPDCSMTIEM